MTWVDWVIIAVFVALAVFGFIRTATKQLKTLVVLGVSIVACVFLAAPVGNALLGVESIGGKLTTGLAGFTQEKLPAFLQSLFPEGADIPATAAKLILTLAGGVGIFILTLVVLEVVVNLVFKGKKDGDGPKLANRFFGAGIGLAKAFVLVAVVVSAFGIFAQMGILGGEKVLDSFSGPVSKLFLEITAKLLALVKIGG